MINQAHKEVWFYICIVIFVNINYFQSFTIKNFKYHIKSNNIRDNVKKLGKCWNSEKKKKKFEKILLFLGILSFYIVYLYNSPSLIKALFKFQKERLILVGILKVLCCGLIFLLILVLSFSCF